MLDLRWKYEIAAAVALIMCGILTAPPQKTNADRRPILTRANVENQSSPRRPPPVMEIVVGERKSESVRKSSTGTAFALDSKGNWMTARHVVQDCKHIFLVIPPPAGSTSNYQLRTKDGAQLPATLAEVIALDQQADLALLHTRQGQNEALSLANPENYTDINQQSGFGIGFPGGKPGEVAVRLMGHAVSLLRLGGESLRQPSLVWSISRLNSVTNDLPGISGGPLVNEQGEIVGVNSAGNARRGRLITAAPTALKNLLYDHPLGQARQMYHPAQPLGEDNFFSAADNLRRNNTIAQAVCFYQ